MLNSVTNARGNTLSHDIADKSQNVDDSQIVYVDRSKADLHTFRLACDAADKGSGFLIHKLKPTRFIRMRAGRSKSHAHRRTRTRIL